MPENKYVIDIEEAAETGRLMLQDQLFTQAMGGLFPEQSDLTSVRQILDLACGPGGWTLEVAFQYPDKEIVGIDINETMINYAFAQARTRNLQNVTFEVMDALKPLDFQDSSFDLINARSIAGFMHPTSWPPFLAECRRLLRPGGIIRFTEVESGISNSLAGQRLATYFFQTLAKQGRTFSTDGNSLGITHMLEKLVMNAGFENSKGRAFHLNSSYGSDLYYGNKKNAEIVFSLLKPYLLSVGLIKEDEYNKLYDQMLIDFMSSDYVSIAFGLTVWGTKPVANP